MRTPQDSNTSAARRAAFQRRIRLACIWSWPIGVTAFMAGFIGLAGMVPPPSPAWSSQEIADLIFSNVASFRFGILVALFSSALLLPFFALISEEMKKIEGEFALLSTVQWGGAVALVMVFQIIGLAWITASFRPDGNVDVIRMLNDYSWFCWSTFIPTYSLQYVCMAIAGFMDDREKPLWPRWAAYLNLWVAVTGAGGGLAVFFKTGPFAWNGVVGFWIPVIVFGLGMTVTAYCLYRRLAEDEYEAAGAAEPLQRAARSA